MKYLKLQVFITCLCSCTTLLPPLLSGQVTDRTTEEFVHDLLAEALPASSDISGISKASLQASIRQTQDEYTSSHLNAETADVLDSALSQAARATAEPARSESRGYRMLQAEDLISISDQLAEQSASPPPANPSGTRMLEASDLRHQATPPPPEDEIFTAEKALDPAVVAFFNDTYGLDLTTEANKSLYSFISTWHQTPYRWGGTTRRGVDCSGFVQVLFDTLFEARLPRVSGDMYHVCLPVQRESLQEGDLVFFAKRGYISHVGIYLRDNKFVHSTSGRGVIISSLDEPYYQRRFYGAGRVEENSTLVEAMP